MTHALAIPYEHPLWFEPLFAVLDRRGLDYVKLRLQDHIFDPQDSPPPAPLVFSRLAMSSFLREADHPLFYAQALYAHWEAQGARVLNGSGPLGIDISKARQMALVRSLGLQTPRARIVHRFEDLVRAADGLRWPVLVKADIGGSGAGIARYDSVEDLAQAAADRTAPMGVNSVALVQEYAPRRDGRITRIEVMGGKMLYAIHVESPVESFDLCPADACMIGPGKAAIRFTRVEPPAELVRAAEAIVKAGGFDIAGVEYMIDDRDGSALFYDVNGLSNFVADPMNVLGFDPHEPLVDWLETQISQAREAA